MPARKSTNLDWLKEHIQIETDDCILWPFYRDKLGYGRIGLKGRLELTHRVAFFLAHGRWPKPCALHRCDMPACVNVRHLFEGTQADNNRDCAKKLRHGGGKLTAEIVQGIRRDYVPRKPGRSTYALGRKYGVSQSMISLIVSGKNWRHAL